MTKLALERGLTIKIGNCAAPFISLEKVSRDYRNFLSALNVGASKAPRCTIHDINDNCVAHVSFNGRVWEGADYVPDSLPLYDTRLEA